MDYSVFSQELLNEFAAHFPDIDFSGIESGYREVERKLVSHVKEFTAEQWKLITDCKYNQLFQDGSPHIDWNTDRRDLCWVLIKDQCPCQTWSETWYDCRKYSIKTNDAILEITVEDPRPFSNSRTHYYLRVAKEFTPVPTHRAIIIGLGSDTRAYIGNQFAGTLDECENWVAKNVKGGFFKIMEIK